MSEAGFFYLSIYDIFGNLEFTVEHVISLLPQYQRSPHQLSLTCNRHMGVRVLLRLECLAAFGGPSLSPGRNIISGLNLPPLQEGFYWYSGLHL